MILLFVGFPSLTPPVGTPLLQLLQRGAFQMAFGRDTFLQNQKAPFGTPDLRLVTCDLRLSPTCLNSSRLQPVLIYHQFASAAATTFANVIIIPACTNGGQQGVIAQDWRLRQTEAKEGTPSSRNSLIFFITCIGTPSSQKIFFLMIVPAVALRQGAPGDR